MCSCVFGGRGGLGFGDDKVQTAVAPADALQYHHPELINLGCSMEVCLCSLPACREIRKVNGWLFSGKRN